jgi:ethanolaminephosphotransferase
MLRERESADAYSTGRRRTHQSGPLGELFDHGVDAVNTSLEVLVFAASQNLGMGWKTVLVLFGGTCNFTGTFNIC